MHWEKLGEKKIELNKFMNDLWRAGVNNKYQYSILMCFCCFFIIAGKLLILTNEISFLIN
jgi:hypothetical protein